MSKTLKSPSEASIQAAFFEWIAYVAVKVPEVGLCYAIPNGSHKSPAARGMFKRTGLKAGVPDVHLPLPSQGKNGLWIEFKSKRGTISDEQWTWITMLRLAGHQVEICRSWESAANIVIDYLTLDFKRFDKEALDA